MVVKTLLGMFSYYDESEGTKALVAGSGTKPKRTGTEPVV
jgi:hypothetical protein